MPCSSHTTFLNFVPIWLPHWPACLFEISLEEAAWRREHAGGKGRGGRGGAKKRKKPRVKVWHGKKEMPMARARVSRTRESSGFATPTSRAVCAVQSALGVGGCGYEILVLATWPLQVANASNAAMLFAAGQEQLGRCAAGWSKHNKPHVGSGELIPAEMYLRRVHVSGRSFAAAPTRVSAKVTPPAHVVLNLSVSLRRPYRVQTSFGMPEVSRDAAAAGEEQLGRCIAE
jgi:hypothetical protein